MKDQRRPRRSTLADRAVSEALRLYHAWLGYLLKRLGEQEVRVPARELAEALGRLSCTARREGEEYVISFVQLEEGAERDGREQEQEHD